MVTNVFQTLIMINNYFCGKGKSSRPPLGHNGIASSDNQIKETKSATMNIFRIFLFSF